MVDLPLLVAERSAVSNSLKTPSFLMLMIMLPNFSLDTTLVLIFCRTPSVVPGVAPIRLRIVMVYGFILLAVLSIDFGRLAEIETIGAVRSYANGLWIVFILFFAGLVGPARLFLLTNYLMLSLLALLLLCVGSWIVVVWGSPPKLSSCASESGRSFACYRVYSVLLSVTVWSCNVAKFCSSLC